MARSLKETLAAGERAVGNWVSIGHGTVAEIAADLGYDFVLIDLEHTPIGLETLEDLIRTVESAPGETEAVVRVPWNDHVWIKRVLDLGPAGLMIPMIESAGEARDAVEAMQYPPTGRRGLGPARAARYGRDLPEYLDRADDELVTICQIESAAGVDNAGAIAETEGVDAVIVGQGDLSTNLGIFGEWEAAEFETALETVITAADESDVPVGMLALDHEGIQRWVEAGVDFLIAGADIGYLVAGGEAAREEFEAATAAHEG